MNTTRETERVISAIINCVCPECGGPIVPYEEKLNCSGQCGRDWRPVWKRAIASSTSAAADNNNQPGQPSSDAVVGKLSDDRPVPNCPPDAQLPYVTALTR